MSEHLLPGKLTASGACSASRFRIPIIRASPSAEARGEQKLCEHVLADRLTAGIACGTERFFRPIIRV